MQAYAAVSLLSAFLLFLVQPLIAKAILPWFGGAPSVWTICLLFFQSALLAGYAYSKPVIDQSIVLEVAKDLQLTQPNSTITTDPIFILTTPNSATAPSSGRVYQKARSALAQPGWVAYLSELVRRFTRSIPLKARTHKSQSPKLRSGV